MLSRESVQSVLVTSKWNTVPGGSFEKRAGVLFHVILSSFGQALMMRQEENVKTQTFRNRNAKKKKKRRKP